MFNRLNSDKFSAIKAFAVLAIILTITWCIYKPGLNGGFIFDDYHSLKKLVVFEGEVKSEGLKEYLGLSDTGVLKRPISVLSFLLDGQNWPTEAYSFKRTNLIIHLLIGLLLFLLIRNIFSEHKTNAKYKNFIASVSTAIWLLHPFLVSTTLYIVQRMAMLPVLFMLLGMLGYFSFRLKNIKKESLSNEIGMLLCVFISTVFAVLSKENGILVLPLLYLFEVFVLRKYLSLKQLSRRLNLLVFIIPTSVIVLAFFYMTSVNLEGYDIRMFTPIERILTQFRVVTDYIYHLLVPKYFTYGVFADGFKVSTGLFSPVTTLFSLIFVCLLLVSAWLLRQRLVWLSFVIFFFFIALSIESTLIPLEIYYEHRTYLASVFMGVPISLALLYLIKKNPVFYIIPFVLILFIGFLTFLRVQVWKDNFQLHEMTMNKYPESERAITMTADFYARNGYKSKTLELLDRAISRHNSLGLHFNRLQYLCGQENIDYHLLGLYFESAIEAFKTESFNMSSITAFTSIFKKLLTNECKTGQDMMYASQLYEALFLHSNSQREYSKKIQTAYGMHYYLERGEIGKGKDEIKKLIFDYHRYFDVFEGLDILYAMEEYELMNEILNDLRNDYQTTKGLLPDLEGWEEKITEYQKIVNEKNE